MPNETGTAEILEAIQSVAESVQSLATHMDERFSDVERRMATKEDLKRFATKEDLWEFRKEVGERFATKDDLQDFKNEIVSHVDWFAVRHNKYDIELLSLRNASLRHEDRITKLEETISK